LDEFFQSGCARVRLPRTERGSYPSAILINTAGGLTGGDHLSCSVHWASGTKACVAGQAAEKIYRSLGGDAVVETQLSIETDAVAEWLPQETILFDRGRLHRDTLVTLKADSWFLGLEAVILGRTAMGETVQTGKVRDGWRLIRDGRLIYADALLLEGAIAERMNRRAVGDGARAFATMIHAAPDAAKRLDDLREILASSEGAAGASAWDGLLVARFLAKSGDALKRDIVRALSALRNGRALPVAWKC
jgi:urease accessory protein